MGILNKLLSHNSGIARSVLSMFYRDGRAYRVPFGPLRGQRIRYDPSVNFHMMLGLWELDSFDALQRLFNHPGLRLPDNIILDVGANLGMFTLWFANKVGSKGRIFAFEPVPHVAARLIENIRLNNLAKVVILENACTDHDGNVEFFVGHHHHSSSLNKNWAQGTGSQEAQSLTVQGTTIDSFIAAEALGQSVSLIKMDIEGGGIFALPGAYNTIRTHRPLILIESHTPEEDRAISDVLLTHDYAGYRIDNKSWVVDKKATYPNCDGVWGTLILSPSEKVLDVQSALRRT